MLVERIKKHNRKGEREEEKEILEGEKKDK